MAAPAIHRIADALDDFDGSSVYSLGLAEDREARDDTFAVIFSAAEPDLERSGYSVVIEPGQRTANEAVEGCRFDRSSIHVRFTDGAARTLGVPRDLIRRLEVPDREFEMLARGLERIGVPFDIADPS